MKFQISKKVLAIKEIKTTFAHSNHRLRVYKKVGSLS